MRKTWGGLLAFLIVLGFAWPAAAEQTDWQSPTYNFGKVRTVLVRDAVFTYEDPGGRDSFEQYPASEETVGTILRDRLGHKPAIKFITLRDVAKQVIKEPGFPGYAANSPEFRAYVKKRISCYADAVLYLEMRNFGWQYEYQEPYDTTETKTERVKYYGRTSDGKQSTGWAETPVTVLVHHPASYQIHDCAEAYFTLKDARTGQEVWRLGDSRARPSFSFSKDYDPTGPESMLNRIMDNFVKWLPLAS
jgi:hypothetical protein